MTSVKFVVITGGPGAGKTAVLEMARRKLCTHTVILPEAASIVFGGGFWRLSSDSGLRAAQRAIYHIQDEMEQLVREEKRWSFALCDRGTLDGLAYWPGGEDTYWSQVRSNVQTELEKYATVIHLRTPDGRNGYNYQNELRTETPEQAKVIDDRIAEIWSRHPRYIQIPSFSDFTDKATLALEQIQKELPNCCPTLPLVSVPQR